MHLFWPQDMSNTAWAIAKLKYADGPLLDALATGARARICEFSPQQLATTAWAYATLLEDDRPLLEAISTQALPRITEYNPYELQSTLWACARLEWHDSTLFNAISQQAIATMHEFPTQNLAGIAWSVAALKFSDPPLLAAISGTAMANLGKFDSRGLASIAWAIAEIQFRDYHLLKAIASASVPILSDFNPQDLANTAWSVAALRLRHEPLLAAISEHAMRRVGKFKTKHLAATVWSFATLGLLDEPLMAAIATTSVPRISEFLGLELANMAWAYATLTVHDTPFLDAIAAGVVRKIASYNPQMLTMTAWAFAELGFGDSPLFEAIAAQAMLKLERWAAEASSPSEASIPALSLAHAFTSFSERSPAADGVVAAAAAALRRLGHKLDAAHPVPCPPPSRQEGTLLGGALPSSLSEPSILLSSGGIRVVWKPPNWEVTVQDGEEDEAVRGTGRQLQEWLVSNFGDEFPIALDAEVAHGLVHRLDRETSGALFWTVDYRSYYSLRLDFVTERVQKEYLCLCQGWIDPTPRCLDQPVRRIPQKERGAGPQLSEVTPEGKRALTQILTVAHAMGPQGEALSLVKVRIRTGRLHQIRVHMSSEGHPLVGDPAYGGISPHWCPRIFLHACRLVLQPSGQQDCACSAAPDGLRVELPLPQDLQLVLACLQGLQPLETG